MSLNVALFSCAYNFTCVHPAAILVHVAAADSSNLELAERKGVALLLSCGTSNSHSLKLVCFKRGHCRNIPSR